ncbi:MAG: hypothetical protein DI637_01515 [Citromicrobium sp.]|nr:MAG: hypothetical protein DI637_01515 [Citromicrobium sp.]
MAFDPVEHSLPRAGRWVPFMHTLVLHGIDATDAEFAMQVRDRWNVGQVRADLGMAGSITSEGIRLVSVEIVDGLPVSTLNIRINKATMEVMPVAEPDGPSPLVYDLQITRSFQSPEILMRGAFVVQEGSTH